jgi:DNA-binding NtrC family response regulator
MNPHILVVEDDHHLSRLFCKALSAAGYIAQPALTLSQANDHAHAFHYHVIICDMHMGTERSINMLRGLKTRLEQNNTVVIVVSGQAQYRSLVEEMHNTFFMEKPVSISMLVTFIQRLVPHRIESNTVV